MIITNTFPGTIGNILVGRTKNDIWAVQWETLVSRHGGWNTRRFFTKADALAFAATLAA